MTFSIKRFLLGCSGADLTILGKDECAIEQNKYLGIGATILSTAVLASFSGGYALYTVFDSLPLSLLFGLLWGAIIFNLDRYIVSSLRKADLNGGLSRRERLAQKLNEVSRALPRLVLAVFISIVITKPIELRLFNHEIGTEFEKSKIDEAIEIQARADEEFAQIGTLEQKNLTLNNEINEKEKQKYDIQQQKFAELDGWGGSRRPGDGPIHKEKQRAFDRASAELEDLKRTNLPVIAKNDQEIEARKAQKELRIKSEKEEVEKPAGLLKRLEMLDKLKNKHPIINWASNFIVLLFILLETAPIFVKLLSDRGPYDEIFESMEHKVRATEEKKRFEVDDETDTDLSLSSNMRSRQLAAELELSRRTMASLETLAGPEILEAQLEIARLITAEWKRAEVKKLRFVAPTPPSGNGVGRGTTHASTSNPRQTTPADADTTAETASAI
jgi:Domain of unknown function (DUF4407)